MDLLLGKDSNLHRVVSPLRVFYDLRHRDKEVCLPKNFTTQHCFLLKERLSFCHLLDTNLIGLSIPCKYFNKNILFLFKF
jgi:hypothetical protein